MRTVIIESPYGNEDPEIVAENARYARACMKDSLDRGGPPRSGCDLQPTDRSWYVVDI